MAVRGDAVVVAPGVPFEIANAGDGPLRLLCCLPVVARRYGSDGQFVPPWAR